MYSSIIFSIQLSLKVIVFILLIIVLQVSAYGKEGESKQDLFFDVPDPELKGVTSESLPDLLMKRAVPALLVVPATECMAYGQLTLWLNGIYSMDNEEMNDKEFQGLMTYEQFLESMSKKASNNDTFYVYVKFQSHSQCAFLPVYGRLTVKLFHRSKKTQEIIDTLNKNTEDKEYIEKQSVAVRQVIKENLQALQQYAKDTQHDKSELQLVKVQMWNLLQ